MVSGISVNRMGSVLIVENLLRMEKPQRAAFGRLKLAKPAVQGHAMEVVEGGKPKEWIHDEDGIPTCTKYKRRSHAN